jgi:methionyl-tRNA formyltransferase
MTSLRIAFAGTPPFALPALLALSHSRHRVVGVLTQPDRPAGRGRELRASPVKLLAAERGLAVAQPQTLKTAEGRAALAEWAPDLLVVVAYGLILPPAVLAMPRLGCLNIHGSLLPRWRGAAPIQAAIAAGDREIGITVMYMDEGLDTGDILLQRAIDILPADTGGALHDRLAGVAPETLLESLDLLAKGKAPRTPQHNAVATYAPKLKREDGKIDWSDPADAIERKIRAFDPWPGAFMTVSTNGTRNLKIFSATLIDLRGKPGKILRSEAELVVAAGEGALSLGEVQLEGKRRMSAMEFLRGHPTLSS